MKSLKETMEAVKKGIEKIADPVLKEKAKQVLDECPKNEAEWKVKSSAYPGVEIPATKTPEEIEKEYIENAAKDDQKSWSNPDGTKSTARKVQKDNGDYEYEINTVNKKTGDVLESRRVTKKDIENDTYYGNDQYERGVSKNLDPKDVRNQDEKIKNSTDRKEKHTQISATQDGYFEISKDESHVDDAATLFVPNGNKDAQRKEGTFQEQKGIHIFGGDSQSGKDKITAIEKEHTGIVNSDKISQINSTRKITTQVNGEVVEVAEEKTIEKRGEITDRQTKTIKKTSRNEFEKTSQKEKVEVIAKSVEKGVLKEGEILDISKKGTKVEQTAEQQTDVSKVSAPLAESY